MLCILAAVGCSNQHHPSHGNLQGMSHEHVECGSTCCALSRRMVFGSSAGIALLPDTACVQRSSALGPGSRTLAHRQDHSCSVTWTMPYHYSYASALLMSLVSCGCALLGSNTLAY